MPTDGEAGRECDVSAPACGFLRCLRCRELLMRVRRDNGRKERAPVPYDEGRTNHIGRESCATVRENRGVASTAEPVGQPLRHISIHPQYPESGESLVLSSPW